MSRREEVEASIKWIMSAGLTGGAITPNLRDLAARLASDIDARDRIITELLAMLKPEEGSDEVETSEGLLHYNIASRVYRRACEIAGRTE